MIVNGNSHLRTKFPIFFVQYLQQTRGLMTSRTEVKLATQGIWYMRKLTNSPIRNTRENFPFFSTIINLWYSKMSLNTKFLAIEKMKYKGFFLGEFVCLPPNH